MPTRITIERALFERARLGSELRCMGNLPDALHKTGTLPDELHARVIVLMEAASDTARRYMELCRVIADSNRQTEIELSFPLD